MQSTTQSEHDILGRQPAGHRRERQRQEGQQHVAGRYRGQSQFAGDERKLGETETRAVEFTNTGGVDTEITDATLANDQMDLVEALPVELPAGEARPPDAESIRQVSARSNRTAYEDILDDETLIETMEDPAITEDIREWLEETSEDPTVVYLVAESSGEIRGFAQFLAGERGPERTDADEAFLKSLYVHPDHWGAGIGSELLDAGIARLPDSATHLSLAVLADNDIGRGFYESRGFEKVGPSEFEVDGVSYETLIYERQLGNQ